MSNKIYADIPPEVMIRMQNPIMPRILEYLKKHMPKAPVEISDMGEYFVDPDYSMEHYVCPDSYYLNVTFTWRE